MKRILLKLSGEALAGDKKTGFDEATVIGVAKQVKELVDDGMGIEGLGQVPFPIPQNGMQVLWNHQLPARALAPPVGTFRGRTASARFAAAMRGGRRRVVATPSIVRSRARPGAPVCRPPTSCP